MTTVSPLHDELSYAIRAARPARLRSMRDFAEEEIWLPKDGGPFEGRRFRCAFQPFSGLFFDAIDSGRWPRVAAVGPTQTGKTLICHVIPLLYHLAERNESVVNGIPDMLMANDKWLVDFTPILEASPALRALRPRHGEGSAGGHVKSSVLFRNGAIVRFMSAGKRDTGRAGFTARCLAATEIDNFPGRGEGSEETDKVAQLEGRLRATSMMQRRIYLECTVTTPEGRIWREYEAGTASRIICPCPYCDAWVTPEREHLKGWQGAETERQAFNRAAWHCPECDHAITEAERGAMNRRAVLCHHGQEVTPEGRVVGEPPEVFTLGFRWNAFNNLFLGAGDVALDECRAARAIGRDREDAERKLCQQVHCVPYEDPDVEIDRLDFAAVTAKAGHKRGIVPKGTACVVVGVDTGKRKLDWVASAFARDGSGRIIEYGEQPVDWERLGVTGGLIAALEELAAYCEWECEAAGEVLAPVQFWIDSAYADHRDGVYRFCREANDALGLRRGRERFRPTRGYGVRQRQMTPYRAPKARTSEVRYIGRDYHISRLAGSGVLLVHVNADAWKGELHRALAKSADEPGGLALYQAPPGQHRDFFDEITAEERREEYEEGKGTIVYWHTLRRRNHKLDAGYLAQAAGHFALTLLLAADAAPKSRPKRPETDAAGDRPYLATER